MYKCCKFCSMERESFSEALSNFSNGGGGLYVHKDTEGVLQLFAYTDHDDLTIDINFCPFCGRLNKK